MRDMTKRVRTSCLEVAYEDRGSPQAEPVILVHGFPDDIRTWDGVVAPLVDAGYRTLTPFLRGFGPTRFLEKTALRSGQLAALGQDVIEFADALGIERFTLVGHDWGARAAYIVAASWPDESEGSSRYRLATAPPRRGIGSRMIRRGRIGISGTSASSEDVWRWNRIAAGCADGSGAHGLRIGILMRRRLKRPPGPSTTQTSSRYRFTPTAIVGAMRLETIGTTGSKPA